MHEVPLQHVTHQRRGLMPHARGRDVEAAAFCERDGEAERNSLDLSVLVPVE